MSFPYKVTDSNGKQITFESPPERIIALDAAAVEILFSLGEGHRVIGTHSFVTHPPEVTDIPKVGDAFNIDIEAIVDLKPDLVFLFYDRFSASLERAGLKVLYLESLNDDFIKVSDNIIMWGGITGNVSAAETNAAAFKSRVRRIENLIPKNPASLSVFQDLGDFWTPGPDTLNGKVFELLKLRNVSNDISGYAQLSPEIVVERNPQIIIASEEQTYLNSPVFEDVQAVKNGQVLKFPAGRLSIVGPRFIDDIEELAKLVYPTLNEHLERSP